MADKSSRREKLKELPGNVRSRASRVIGRVRKRFWRDEETDAERTSGNVTQAASKPCRRESVWSEKLSLHEWQRDALNWWQDNDYKGVVEAVTGAGKTRTAIAAAEHHFRNGGDCVVVIVPTTALLHQWKREADKLLVRNCGMSLSIGFMGGGHSDTPRNSDLLIATVQTACRKNLLRVGQKGLLILDEVHRYGGDRWSRVLQEGFSKRLGLTATYAREDSGVEKFLDPYFGSRKFSVGYRRALDDGVIAHFKIAFIGVRFTSSEQQNYDENAKKAYKYKKQLLETTDVREKPFGDFMLDVTKLSKSGEGGARLAGFYLNAFSKRRQILAEAAGKYDRLTDLAKAIHAADKTIMFAQTKEAAKEAVERLSDHGVDGDVLDSGMDMSERREVFAAFEDKEHSLVAAPRLLDEGVDVPAADLALVLASSRSRRQMIQRMGRVVRKKKDGRLARLAVLYVENSSEDPNAAHEDFLNEVKDVASEIRTFKSSARASEICDYLNDWHKA